MRRRMSWLTLSRWKKLSQPSSRARYFIARGEILS
jgi:hypothetical protein